MADKANRKLSEVLKKIMENSYSKAEADEYRTVKDLTSLTTQKDIYDAVNVGEYIIFTAGGAKRFGHVDTKDATHAVVASFNGISSVFSISYSSMLATQTNAPTVHAARVNIDTPTSDTHAATKKYVDDTIAAIPVPDIEAKFADGTTTADQASAGYGKTELEETLITIPASIASVTYTSQTGTRPNASLIHVPSEEKITTTTFGSRGTYTYKLWNGNSNIWRIFDIDPNTNDFVRNSDQLEIRLINNVYSAVYPTGGTGGVADVQFTSHAIRENGTEQKYTVLTLKATK